MAMVEARKGNRTIKVSKNSYETMFRKMGYRIVGEEQETKEPESVLGVGFDDMESAETEGEKKEEIETIPISEMNQKQLQEYASEHNIDLTGVKNTREARQRIQKAIRESKM